MSKLIIKNKKINSKINYSHLHIKGQVPSFDIFKNKTYKHSGRRVSLQYKINFFSFFIHL